MNNDIKSLINPNFKIVNSKLEYNQYLNFLKTSIDYTIKVNKCMNVILFVPDIERSSMTYKEKLFTLNKLNKFFKNPEEFKSKMNSKGVAIYLKK